MLARLGRLSLYVLAVVACYPAAWTIAFVVINGGEFAFYFDYLRYFWVTGGGERPAFTGIFSIIITVPLALIAIWILRRAMRATNEKKA